jgi:RNA polymerase sigma-70 factor (ECF subfamily)
VATTSLEDQLVANCQRGEADSFRPLVEQYGDVVFGTLLLVTRDRALAEDLTQETFLHAWRGIGGFRVGAPFRPWLLRIAVNRANSQRRRKWLNIIPLPTTDVPAGDLTPEAAVERDMDRAQVRAAIAQLSHDEQQLVTLRFFAELTVPQMANALSWPEGTVKSRLHRTLMTLRTILEEASQRTQR